MSEDSRLSKSIFWLGTIFAILCMVVCVLFIQSLPILQGWVASLSSAGDRSETHSLDSTVLTEQTPPTPTPDPPRPLPTLRSQVVTYTVQPNDTLAEIAKRYGVDLNTLLEMNPIADPNLLEVGQVLSIPPPGPMPAGPDFKIIPDSELVNGPASIVFNLGAFIEQHNGYLNTYQEEIGDKALSGAEIIRQVATDHSVNPRLLLAILEYQSGWLTQSASTSEQLEYPFGFINPLRSGLYSQANWAANNLNRGYYLWRVNAISHWVLADGSAVMANASINAGTAGVQHFFSQILDQSAWQTSVSAEGLFNTYLTLFGYPYETAIEPLLPPDLEQPPLQLPFEPGQIWSFSGGPHGGWGDGSGWAALDFAPPGEPQGCVLSDAWITAMADGLVVRSKDGVVVQDLDGDGFEQTGWTLLYLHVDKHERVSLGEFLKAGERIGHPSCEGGVSSGAHVHIARRYNGEWIPADGPIPFNLEGWISQGTGKAYDGHLIRDDQVVEAWDRRKPENQIQR